MSGRNVIVVGGLLLIGTAGGCKREPNAQPTGYVAAQVITNEAQTIGGRAAEGRIGDLVLENDHARFILQAAGSARVFGLFGGSLLDADLRHDSIEEGNDQLTEAISLVDFYVSTADTVEVIADGSDNHRAVVRVSGPAVPFPMLPPQILDVFSVPQDLQFDMSTDYVIYPHLSALEIVTTVTSRQDDLPVFQTGEVLMASGDQEAFSTANDPAASFATTGSGVSYAYGPAEGDGDSLAISGVVIAIAPGDRTLNDGDSFTVRRWFTVGSGSAASALEPLYETRNLKTGRLHGTVADESGAPATDATVVVADAEDNTVTTLQPDASGAYSGVVLPGDYSVYTTAPARLPSAPLSIAITKNTDVTADFSLTTPGQLSVTITDAVGGGSVPVRISMFGPSGRLLGYAPTGAGTYDVVPGTYQVVASRGVEYTAFVANDVVVTAGETTNLVGTIERVVDTTGWISADFHLHQEFSPDSQVYMPDRLATLVGEGVEWGVSTDHDFMTDYRPWIQDLGLENDLFSSIGVETSTFILGHFNSWPRGVNADTRGHGAPTWFNLPPSDLFTEVRQNLDVEGVVQVNHPRMSNSYFDAIQFDTATGLANADPTELGFAAGTDMLVLDFDAIEAFNGKRVDDLFGNADQQGAIFDWFALLNLGYRFTLTGNSDSHSTTQEVGYPRNFVQSSTDDPAALDEVELSTAVREHRSIVSGGPFITVDVRPEGQGTPGAEVGGELALPGGAQNVDVAVRIQAPPWMDVARIQIYQNSSTPVQTVNVPASLNVVRYDDVITMPVSQDSWFVVYVEGDVDMSPVLPGEKPMSFSNPIWVDLGADGFTPPGL